VASQPFFVPALLLFLAAIPLVLGLVPPNALYGFRTSKTLTDDNVWYRSNRFGGWALLISGAVYFMIAKIYPTSGPDDSDFSLWLLHLGGFVLPLIASVLMTLRYAGRLSMGAP
jgi:uncharacterized membrane protein